MKKDVLFIGGPADGQRMAIDEGRGPGFITVAVPPSVQCIFDPHQEGPGPRALTHGVEVDYHRMTLQGPSGEFTVYHADGGDVIEQLINGYRGQP